MLAISLPERLANHRGLAAIHGMVPLHSDYDFLEVSG